MAEEGLAKVEKIYQDRGGRAKELRAQGKKIIGCYCCYAPPEIITAAGLVPYRITGDVKETIREADSYLEAIMCPFCRNSFDMALRGEYDFLDGFVVPHTCDNIVKIYDVWKYNLKPPYSHFINVPHTLSAASLEFFKAELGTFQRSIERLIGREISLQQLKESIKLHNEYRALVRELYELSKPDPPLISGSERMKVLLAGTRVPVEEANELLRSVISEVKERRDVPPKKPARVLVYGPEIDDAPFIELVEGVGADVVIDDLCVGTRPYWFDVEINGDPLGAMAQAYLEKVNCPRTYRPRTAGRKEDLDNRFGYIANFAKEYKVNGIILLILNYCDNYEFESVEVKDYLQQAGFPGLIIEVDYTLMSIDWLKTRVQAFLEMIS